MLGHPSAPVSAAALAAGEFGPWRTGPALVHAFLLGFEVETTIAAVINPAHYEHGLHATCTLGTIGAAAAAARLLGLDVGADAGRARRRRLAGLGAQENFGTMTKPFTPVTPARSGVPLRPPRARRLDGVGAGHRGAAGVIPRCSARAAATSRRSIAGRAVEDSTTTGVAVKPYPSCACTHSIIDSALELQPHAWIRPRAGGPGDGRRERGRPAHALIHSGIPRSGLEAKFSGEFSAAAALFDGRVGIATFGDDKMDDPRCARS